MCFSDLLWGDCLPALVTHPLTVNDEVPSHPRTISVRCGTPLLLLLPRASSLALPKFANHLQLQILSPHLLLSSSLGGYTCTVFSRQSKFLSIFLHFISFNTSPLWGVTSFRRTQANSVPTKMSIPGRCRLSSNQSAWYSSTRSTQHFKGLPPSHGFHFLLTFCKLTWSGVFWDFFFQYPWQLNPLQLGNQVKVGNWRACSEKRPENDCLHIEQRWPSVAQI